MRCNAMHGQRFSHGMMCTQIHERSAALTGIQNRHAALCAIFAPRRHRGHKKGNDFRACRSHFGIRIICLRNCRQHLHIFLRSSKRVASRGILRKRIKDYRTKNVKFCLIQRECAGEKTGKSGKCAKQVNKIAQKIKKFCESPCYLWLGVL